MCFIIQIMHIFMYMTSLSMREFILGNFTSWELSHVNTRQGNLIIEHTSVLIFFLCCPFTLIYSLVWYFDFRRSLYQNGRYMTWLVLHFNFIEFQASSFCTDNFRIYFLRSSKIHIRDWEWNLHQPF